MEMKFHAETGKSFEWAKWKVRFCWVRLMYKLNLRILFSHGFSLYHQDFPKQTNDYDCGIFALKVGTFGIYATNNH